MRKINKADYFYGAFLSYLISNGIEPTLFETGDKIRILEFLIRNTTYKAYLKYSTTKRTTIEQEKETQRWDIVFSSNELKIMQNFGEDNKKAVIIFICTDEELSNTDIAILPYPEACKCMGLGVDRKNNQRRISIQHSKHSRWFQCYGTGLADTSAIEVPYNFQKSFGLDEDEVL